MSELLPCLSVEIPPDTVIVINGNKLRVVDGRKSAGVPWILQLRRSGHRKVTHALIAPALRYDAVAGVFRPLGKYQLAAVPS